MAFSVSLDNPCYFSYFNHEEAQTVTVCNHPGLPNYVGILKEALEEYSGTFEINGQMMCFNPAAEYFDQFLPGASIRISQVTVCSDMSHTGYSMQRGECNVEISSIYTTYNTTGQLHKTYHFFFYLQFAYTL